MRAIEELDGQELDDLKIQVSLAKPQVDKTQQRRGQSGFGALNQRGRGDQMSGPRGGGGRGRGRGGYGGYDGGYSQGGYDGYDDSSYDDYYGPPSRPRGGQMSRGGPMRGGRGNPRGGASSGFRGRGGGAQGRGGPMMNRGGRGNTSRGGMGQRGGGGNRGSYGRGGANTGRGGMAPKRKADFGNDYNTPQKRKNEGGWNSQPIAQQPLNSSSNNYYNDDYSGQDWYTDLSAPRWQ